LPDSPHDIPHPSPKSGLQEDKTDVPHKGTTSSDDDDEESDEVIQPLHAFLLSLTMIIFSEIGDKTFLVAALMAMRHPRILVFSAAFTALFVMTVLSAVLGHAVPTLLPVRLTHIAAAILFFVFGIKLLREGWAMSPDEGVSEEMREVEQELEEKESLARRNSHRRSSAASPFALESGRAARRSRSNQRLPAPARSPSTSPSRSPSPHGSAIANMLSGLNNLFSLLLSPAWVQTFVMTFLGEWGDRSQIATIAMAAGQDYWWITGGAVLGHAICTAAAVIGGRAVAGKVSMRVGKFSVEHLNVVCLTNSFDL
jgi:Ca2+/H+ antiporter, TMEM165/GDT1 family